MVLQIITAYGLRGLPPSFRLSQQAIYSRSQLRYIFALYTEIPLGNEIVRVECRDDRKTMTPCFKKSIGKTFYL